MCGSLVWIDSGFVRKLIIILLILVVNWVGRLMLIRVRW